MPSLIYLILSIMAIIMFVVKGSYVSAGTKAIFAIVWTFFLNFLCSKGYEGASWFLLFLPLIIMVIIMAFFASKISSIIESNEHK